MAKTMHAAVVETLREPLVLREVEIPSPGPGQILVKTEACGVCHTDLHAAKGDWPAKPTLPFIPGHEGIGLVFAMGAGVTAVKEGDRVGVPWLYSACGHCEHCLSAWETVCAKAEFGGYTKNGGFAEYILADPNYVAHVPPGLAATEAAPLICAGVTTYKGIKVTEARPGEWLVVSGAGGLGHLAIQYAKAMGLRVCAVDIDDGKLAHARKLGADVAVNARQGDAVAAVKSATGGGAHGVLITAPSLGAFRQGVGMTRKRGTCVLVGCRLASSRCRCLTSLRTASPSEVLSLGPGRTWPKLWPLRPTAASEPTSSYSRFRRLTTSLHGWSMEKCHHAWCSTSLHKRFGIVWRGPPAGSDCKSLRPVRREHSMSEASRHPLMLPRLPHAPLAIK